jgi:DNA-binding CsgD family transcriptional regulator
MEGREWLNKAMATAGDARTVTYACALIRLTMLEWALGGPPRDDLVLQAVALLREFGDDDGHLAPSLLAATSSLIRKGDLDRAQLTIDEAFDLFEQENDLFGLATCWFDRGRLAWLQGDFARARAHYERSFDLHLQSGAVFGLTGVQMSLGRLYEDQGNIRAAATSYLESLRLWDETLSPERLIDGVTAAGRLAVLAGRAIDAAGLFGAAAALEEPIAFTRKPYDQGITNDAISRTRSMLDEQTFHESMTTGRGVTAQSAWAKAVAMLEDLSASTRAPSTEPPPGGLTPRELDVVSQIAAGKSNREIGESLFVSKSTVISHVRNIMAKLDLDSRSAVAAWAVRNGLG